MIDAVSLRSSLSKSGLWVKDGALSALEKSRSVIERVLAGAFISYGYMQMVKHLCFALEYAGADLNASWARRSVSYIATQAGGDILLGDSNYDNTICRKVQEWALGSEATKTFLDIVAKGRNVFEKAPINSEAEKKPLSLKPTENSPALNQKGRELKESFIKNSSPQEMTSEDASGDQGFFSRAAGALYDTLGFEGKRVYNSLCNGGIDPVEHELRGAATWGIIAFLASLALYGVYSRSQLKEERQEKQDWKKQAQALSEAAVLDKKIIEELQAILLKKETSSETPQDSKNAADKKAKISKRWNFLKKVSKIFRRSSIKTPELPIDKKVKSFFKKSK